MALPRRATPGPASRVIPAFSAMAAAGPLTADGLMRRAVAYLSRRAASTAQVRAVLERAVRRAERNSEPVDGESRGGDMAGLVEPVLARLDRAGLLDDAAFARMKAGSLAAKGKPARTIRADLTHRYGVAVDATEGLRESLAALDPAAQALRWAERRRLGPFRIRDRALRRERDVASLVRAGFPVGIALAVIDGAGRGDEPGAEQEDAPSA